MYKNQKIRKTNNPYRQSFTPYEPQYVLNPVTNNLEAVPGPGRNVQEKIQSYVACALESALERFLPKDVQDDDTVVADYTQRMDDLGLIGEAMEVAEDYRERYNLPDNYSARQIYEFVQKQANDLKGQLTDTVKRSKKEKNDSSVKEEKKEI